MYFLLKAMMYMLLKMNYGKQILIPAIKSVVKKVDLENKKIEIQLIEGLI